MTPPSGVGPRRQIVIVSGAPGSGKTTLAVPLAEALGFPLFAKDHIKEALFDSLGVPAGDLAASRRIGGAAMEVIWTLAARAPRAVLEANFRPQSGYERTRLQGLEARIVEVYCVCEPAEAMRRFAARAKSGVHPAHVLPEMPLELFVEYSRPVGVGEIVEVDTSAPVDIDAVAGRVRRALAG